MPAPYILVYKLLINASRYPWIPPISDFWLCCSLGRQNCNVCTRIYIRWTLRPREGEGFPGSNFDDKSKTPLIWSHSRHRDIYIYIYKVQYLLIVCEKPYSIFEIDGCFDCPRPVLPQHNTTIYIAHFRGDHYPRIFEWDNIITSRYSPYSRLQIPSCGHHIIRNNVPLYPFNISLRRFLHQPIYSV